MEYRVNKRTGDRVSVIGLGTSVIAEEGESEGIKTLELAFESGINYIDLAGGDFRHFGMLGKTVDAATRKRIMYELHFGADYTSGEYGWSLNADVVRRSVEKQLEALKTDYIDYGFIHCMDEVSDWERYKKNGVFDYLLKLKSEGVVRHIGMSSHTPATIQAVVKEVELDMLLFSINAAYDFERGDDYGIGSAAERRMLYADMEKKGTGIVVMKPFSGGQLLSAKTSPFGVAMTEAQCIKFALDKPGVLSVVPGVKNRTELKRALSYLTATEEERDYSHIASFTPRETAGKCVYCNHCMPCPAGIDIGSVTKFYDLAAIGDDMAREHYFALSKRADACIRCGHCTARCPFKAEPEKKMGEIAAYFGSRS